MNYNDIYPNEFKGFDGKYHYLYKITNNINDKVYYGIHSTLQLGDGYFGSGKFLKKAIKKYGKSHFQKTILTFCNSREQINILEAHIVNQRLLESGLTYNLKIGGDNVLDPHNIEKLKQANKKQVVLLETGQIFESISEAGEFIGYTRGIPISRCMNEGIQCKGFHFALLEMVPTRENQLKELQRQIKIKNNRRNAFAKRQANRLSVPVIDLLTGRIYSSGCEASRQLNITSIQASLHDNIPVYGHLFSTEVVKFKDNPELRLQTYNQIIEDNKNKEHKNRIQAASKHAKPCRCIETGIEYPSCRAASKAIGVNLHGVEQAIRFDGKSGGYHWEYV